MKRMLFNATQAEELRVAIVDGQNLIDLDIETLGKEQRKGNIYKGVITRIEPSLEACFVDYGTDRHGFLPFKEVSRAYFQDYDGGRARIQDVLREGMEVIVQVEKDERGNKGAALTTFVSLAGRYLVLMPNNPRGGGVSRRIEGEDRQELKEMMSQLDIPKGMSLIARTAGIGRSLEDLEWDLNYLLQLWSAIEEAASARNGAFLILQESALVIRAIRDYFQPDIGEILIDTPEVFEEVSQFMSYVMPSNVNRIKQYEDHTPLFSRFQIEHQIESAFSRSVNLPSGGAIVIDHTEALVSIDVNSARATRGADIEDTAFKTNVEAAEEIARQLRLRDLGGLIVIDFIDMENQKNQREVEQTLRDALRYDRARVQMGKLSRFGLLELSRQRLQPSLGESSHMPCPRCHGIGFIRGIESSALHILRIIQEEAMKDNTGEVHAQVPVDVATFLLNEKRSELFSLEERLDVGVLLIPNSHLETPHYEITRVRTDDVEEAVLPSYKRVNKPEEDETVVRAGKKAERQEPAVKGIRPAQPAPLTEEKPVSLFAKIGAWIKGLLGEKEAEVEKPKTSKQPQRRTPYGKRQNNRRNQNQRSGDKAESGNGNDKRQNGQSKGSEGDKQQERAPRKDRNSGNNQGNAAQKQEQGQGQAKERQGDKRQNPRNNDKRQQGQRQQDEQRQADKVEKVEKAQNVVAEQPEQAVEQAQGTERRRRRNNRRDRKPDEQNRQAQGQEGDNAQEAPLVINLAEAQADDKQVEEKRAPEQEKGNRREGGHNRRRRNNRGRPATANYLIRRIDIHAIGDQVRSAVDHIYQGKLVVVAEQAPEAVVAKEAAVIAPIAAEAVAAVPVAPVAVAEAVVAPVVVEAKPEPVTTPVVAKPAPVAVETKPAKPAEPMDLGHLVMVETKSAATSVVDAAPVAPVKRRSDVLAAKKVVSDDQPQAVVLKQVETQKGE
ncbi:MAG: Rne/Rng family ribonuclease [Neisseriaceae bacterium]|nr:Rne/Rng family ribonuclease [Neisseriaceae bacterium]MBP6862927.1 Rne/Rng family ribonuclease [Neisseriaceae bacterium]